MGLLPPKPIKGPNGDATGARAKVIARALIVEPEATTLRLCRDALETSGFVLDAVDSGIDALIVARERHPDVILIALQLRDVPGLLAIEWLRSNAELQTVPIIVLTTDADDEAELETIRPGMSLRKPVSQASIRRAVNTVLS